MPESTERGALTEAVYYILLSLYTPTHGYAVMQKIRKLSNDRVNLGAGTLYGAINILVKKKWIESFDSGADSRKKDYLITKLGRQIVTEEIVRLQELVDNGNKVLGRYCDENN